MLEQKPVNICNTFILFTEHMCFALDAVFLTFQKGNRFQCKACVNTVMCLTMGHLKAKKKKKIHLFQSQDLGISQPNYNVLKY